MPRSSAIKFRRGDAAVWTALNPTLAAGEPGFETDTGKVKIGDGSTAWASLGYQLTAAAAATAYQPLDSDLTSIAALSTTAYGRALLALADQAALTALIGAATTALSGAVELATTAETETGTDTVRAVTPEGAAATFVKKSLVDAAGDLLVGSADNTLARLAPGTTGQVPVIDDAANKITWGHSAHSRSAFLKPTAALYESADRATMAAANLSLLVSGTAVGVAIALPKGLTVSSISFVSGTTALAAGTNQWFCLADSSRVAQRFTADDTSTAWSANTLKTLALTSTFTTTYAGLHYLFIMVAAGTVPTLTGLTSTVSGAFPPILCGSSTTGLTTVASAPGTFGALSAYSGRAYAYVS